MPFPANNAASMPAYRGTAWIETIQGPAQVDGVAVRKPSPKHVVNIPTYRPNVAGLIARFEALGSKSASTTLPTRGKCVADGHMNRPRITHVQRAPLESPGLVAAVMRIMADTNAQPEVPMDEVITSDSPTRTLVSKQGFQISAFLGFDDLATGEPEHLRGM